MKKHCFTRIACFVVMLGLLTSTASAASSVQPRYVKISILSSELLGISLAGRATCCGSVSLWDSSCKATLYVELQQSDDGDSWTTIKSWSDSGYGDVIIEEYWYVDSGYQYRVLTTAIVYSGTGAYIETEMAESTVQTYSTP